MINRRGAIAARKLLDQIGFVDISHLSMREIAEYLGCYYIEEPLSNSDGKIVRGKSQTLIKINSNIRFEARKRFAGAHEIGHFILHPKLEVHSENANTLNWFDYTEKLAIKGKQEYEANDFASELLMPQDIFIEDATNDKFTPQHLKWLAEGFKTSLTSTIFRIVQFDIFPLCIVFISNGIVRYWKKSESLKLYVGDITKLPPPKFSVAREYVDAGYEFIYTGKNKAQKIFKSTWFELGWDNEDPEFFEYCIPTKEYRTIVSIIWPVS